MLTILWGRGILLQGKFTFRGEAMLSYRNLTENDCAFIYQRWVGKSSVFRQGLSEDELHSTIQKMNTKMHNGNYYEIFGVLDNDVLVGTFSFYQREGDIPEDAVYFGIEISEENRRKGFAAETVLMAFELAREKGYKKIFSRARVDNIASVNLHEKCGFLIVEKNRSKAGHEVYDYAENSFFAA